MWAAAYLASSQSQAWPPVTLPGSPTKNVKAPPKFIRFRQRLRTRDEDEDIAATQHKVKDEDKAAGRVGAVGEAVRAAFKSPTPDTPRLSGSDVLRALEKASIRKTKQSLKERGKKRGNSPQGRDQLTYERLGDTPAASLDHISTNDGALDINSEWGVRLEELERRLRDIMLLAHV